MSRFKSEFFKLPSLILFFFLCSNAKTIHGRSAELDLLRVEGVYAVDTDYIHPDGQKKTKIDRLIVFKNVDRDDFTVAMAVSEFNIPFVNLENARATVTDDTLHFSAEGQFGNEIYGELNLSFDRETLNVEGSFVDSIANGRKEFKGTPIYNMSKCLYQNEDPNFVFPSRSDFSGEYKNDEGHGMIVRSYSSKAMSMVIMKRFGSDPDEFVRLKFRTGRYNQEYGFFSFPLHINDAKAGVAHLIYRLDENGKPYYKVFQIGISGLNSVWVFRYDRPIFDLGQAFLETP